MNFPRGKSEQRARFSFHFTRLREREDWDWETALRAKVEEELMRRETGVNVGKKGIGGRERRCSISLFIWVFILMA